MLKKRLMYTYTILIFVVILILGMTVVKVIVKTIDDQMKKVNEQILEEGLRGLQNYLSSIKSSSLDICNDTSLQEYLQIIYKNKSNNNSLQRQQSIASDILRLRKNVNGEEIRIYPIDESGNIYSWSEQTGKFYINNNLREESWFKKTLNMNGRFYWSHVEYLQKSFIRLSKVIIDTSDWDSVLGVLVVDLNTDALLANLNNIQLGKTGRVYIVDDNGIILPYAFKNRLDEEVFKNSSDREFINSQNEMVIIRKMRETKWKLVGTIPIDQILEKGDSIQTTFYIVGIAAVALATLLAYYFSKIISEPIMKLAKTMKMVESGDLNIKIDSKGKKGEIKILYSNFNYMINMINDLIDEVYISKIKEKEAELMALQVQINPHFLYNTLDSINWMSLKYGAKDIQTMVTSLASMLRCSLNNGENMITVSGEIEQVKSYIDIQKIRFSNSFDAIYEIDEKIYDYIIIKLLLQPIVENAIIHGFEEGDECGKLYVKGFKDKGHIVFRIMNNGNKIDLEHVNRILNPQEAQKAKSYGIKNVNDRLIKKYGERYALRYSIEGEYTVAEIKIPIYD